MICLLALVAIPTLLQAEEKLEESPYFPLKIGNAWHYRRGDGVALIVRVAKHEKVGDHPCALLETEIDGRVLAREHLGVTKDGICRFAANGGLADPPFVVFKLPAVKGSTWTVKCKVGPTPVQGTFRLDEAKLEVPAGKYDAMVAITEDSKANDIAVSTTQYYVKDVGLVKQLAKIGDRSFLFELEKFVPAK